MKNVRSAPSQSSVVSATVAPAGAPFSPARSSGEPRTCAILHRMRLWGALFLGVAALLAGTVPAHAQEITVEWVTRIGAPTGAKLDQTNNNRDLRLGVGKCSVELWADGIEEADTAKVLRTSDGVEMTDVRVTLGTRRNGATNNGRGAMKGSAEVSIDATAVVGTTGRLARTIRLTRGNKAWKQQINIVPLPSIDLRFQSPAASLNPASCLGQATVLNNNRTLQVQLPPGAATDTSNCQGQIRLLATFTGDEVDEAPDGIPYSLTTAVTQKGIGVKQQGTTTGLGGISIPRFTTFTTVVPVTNPPKFFELAAPLNVNQQLPNHGFALALDTSSGNFTRAWRTLTRETKLEVTLSNPAGKKSTAVIDIIPPAPPPPPGCINSGFAVAVGASQSTGAIIEVDGSVDINVVLGSNAPPEGRAITYRVNAPRCFQTPSPDNSTHVSLPITNGLEGVGVITVAPGTGAAPGAFVVRLKASSAAPECVGTRTRPSTLEHIVDLYCGDFNTDSTLLTLPLGPRHVQVKFIVRDHAQ